MTAAKLDTVLEHLVHEVLGSARRRGASEQVAWAAAESEIGGIANTTIEKLSADV